MRPIMTMTWLLAAVHTAAAATNPIQPEPAPLGTMPSRHVAHIYYNIATGEKIAVPLGDVRPTDNGASPKVWIADNTLPCADFGQLDADVIQLDDMECNGCFSSACGAPQMHNIMLDWGDTGFDQVVDCVGVSWSTRALDHDFDNDGIGDGVPGFAVKWTWYDGNNGFNTTLRPVSELMMVNAPGSIGQLPDETYATYTATIDLASDQVFELGDTDSVDGSDTGNFNPGTGQDLDSDGLHDFGYSIQYFQPGYWDLDGDGTNDGQFGTAGSTAWILAVPGDGAVLSNGSWSLTNDGVSAGAEDAFDIYDVCYLTPGVVDYIGTFFAGGFSCDADGDGDTGDTFAFGQFYNRMYGPDSGCVACPADIFPDAGIACDSGDGVLNFFDVSLYLTWFGVQDPRADLFPSEGDGQFNFFDISVFVTNFVAGCP